MLLVAIGASFGSNTGLRNHENLVNRMYKIRDKFDGSL
jgi:hypothetical protein